MKGFIEVHSKKDRKPKLIGITHITEVFDNRIYTDDLPNFAVEWTYTECVETYEEIKALINNAE